MGVGAPHPPPGPLTHPTPPPLLARLAHTAALGFEFWGRFFWQWRHGPDTMAASTSAHKSAAAAGACVVSVEKRKNIKNKTTLLFPSIHPDLRVFFFLSFSFLYLGAARVRSPTQTLKRPPTRTHTQANAHAHHSRHSSPRGRPVFHSAQVLVPNPLRVRIIVIDDGQAAPGSLSPGREFGQDEDPHGVRLVAH